MANILKLLLKLITPAIAIILMLAVFRLLAGSLINEVAYNLPTAWDYVQTEEQGWRLYLYENTENYADFKLLSRIIFAESSWRQFEEDGKTVLSGRVHSPDKGLFQINLVAHAATLEEMELDYSDPYDNIDYGIHLYYTQGTQPWKNSSKNW